MDHDLKSGIYTLSDLREPIVTLQQRATTNRKCCSSKIICALFCTFSLFWIALNIPDDISLSWKETDLLNWRTTENHFTIKNYNLIKNWYTPDTNLQQHFWHCDDILAEQPSCDWIKTQSFQLPEYKIDKPIKPGKKMNFVVNNSHFWRENTPYWEDMKEACKYDLLLTFWTLGNINSPVYRLCAPIEGSETKQTKEQKGNKQERKGQKFRNFFSFNS
mgnify:CR=1 FL=1